MVVLAIFLIPFLPLWEGGGLRAALEMVGKTSLTGLHQDWYL